MPRKATRGAQGGGSIRQRRDGRWEARFTVGRDPGTGKQVQRSVYGATQREARQKLAAAVAALDEGTYTPPARITFGQWLDIYVTDFCGGVKPRTRELYRSSIDARIKPALGAVRLGALTTPMIQRFYNQSMQGENAVSAKTVRNLHGIVHKALEQAVSAGYLRANPAAACQPPRVEKPEIRPLDEAQTQAFIAAAQGDPFETLFLVDLFTGLREGEILGLQWDAVDLDAGTIRVVRQLQLHKGTYQLMPTKNGKPRQLTPAPFVMNLLRAQRREQAQMKLLAGQLWEDTGFVFTDALGRHLARQTVYRHFKKLADRIGLPDARLHDLRHTYAVASIRAGDDPKTVSENLGHATVAFTLDVYGHVTASMREASAQRMQAYIDNLNIKK